MIIIGHYAISYESFVRVSNIEEVSSAHQSCIVWFDSATLASQGGFDIARHCHQYGVSYAVMFHSLEELLIYAALLPQYLIIPEDMEHEARNYQAIIEHYLLDCKLLCVVETSKQIEKIAQLGIDGAIFKQVLGNI